MKLVLNGTQKLEVVSKPNLAGDPLSFHIAEEDFAAIPQTITGQVLVTENISWPKEGPVEEESENEELQPFVLYETFAERWLRTYTSGNMLYFTNIPEPKPLPQPTPEEVREFLATQVRQQRDALLASTDWTQLLDSQLDEISSEEVRMYRQALRDVPQQEGFPENVVWPELPDVFEDDGVLRR